MRPVMYIVLNKGAKMSPGKLAAQAAHASVQAYLTSKVSLFNAWQQGGHYTKIILEARDETHLASIERYIRDRGFKTSLIIDEGRTEVEAHTVTALGVEIVDKDDPHVAATFSTFETYKQPRLPAAVEKLKPGQQVVISRAGDDYVAGTVRQTIDFDPPLYGPAQPFTFSNAYVTLDGTPLSGSCVRFTYTRP